jgi:hypothetical protein
MDDVISLNNYRFGDFVDRIYRIELEIKDTPDTDKAASYLDLHLGIDSEMLLRTNLYDKRDGDAVKNETLRHTRWGCC